MTRLISAYRFSRLLRTAGRLWCLCFLLILAGCAAPQYSETIISGDSRNLTELEPGNSIGQTFISHQAGLNAVAVYLAVSGTNSAGSGELTLHLRRSALPGETDLRTGKLRLPIPSAPGWYRFEFEPIGESYNQSYYYVLENSLPQGTRLNFAQAGSDAYIDGTFYLNDRAQAAQLASQLDYAAVYIVANFINWIGQFMRDGLILFLLFVLPGLALQAYLLPLPEEPLRNRLLLATGISLSLYPVLFLWAHVMNLALGTAAIWAIIVAAVLALGWRYLRSEQYADMRARGYFSRSSSIASIIALPALPRLTPANLAWLLAIGLVCFVRFLLSQFLEAPMGADAIEHATIIQLMLDHHGLFNSWLPYAPYQSFSIQFGFHSAVAAFVWLTGEPLLGSILIVQQMMNCLAVLALVPLATMLVPNKWGGIGAVVLTGLLAPLPNGYLIWSRDAQLAGQVVMPVALWLAWRIFEPKPAQPAGLLNRRSTGLYSVAALVFAGTFLAYYRMPYYVGVLVALLIVYVLLKNWRNQRRVMFAALIGLAISAVLTLVFVLPWLINLKTANLGQTLTSSVTLSREGGFVPSSSFASVQEEYRGLTDGSLLAYLPLPMIVLALAGTFWGSYAKKARVVIMALWAVGVLLLPASRLIHLPGASALQGTAMLISLYIPAGLLGGYAIDRTLSWLALRRRQLLALALVGLLVAGLLGARDRLQAIDPLGRTLTPADIKAIAWIRMHVPANALFMVDGFLMYGGTSAIGYDGGLWIPLLAERNNTMPPQYALLSERPVDPAYNRLVTGLVSEFQAQPDKLTSAEGIALLCRSHITHIYADATARAVPPMISLPLLEQSPAFTLIYRQDKIGVFALNEPACH